jgi:hypothetical protein
MMMMTMMLFFVVFVVIVHLIIFISFFFSFENQVRVSSCRLVGTAVAAALAVGACVAPRTTAVWPVCHLV